MDAIQLLDPSVQRAFPEFRVEFPRLGYGGYKVAYRAVRPDRTVALKILRNPISLATTAGDDLDFDVDSFDARFGREILAMSTSASPHIVEIVAQPSLREIGGSIYGWYAEEYLVGGTLQDRLRSGVKLDPAEIFRLADDLLTAICHMWDTHKFCHRDIKPGNIGLNESGSAVLVDLGTALFPDLDDITGTGEVAPATGSYAAPEQFGYRRTRIVDFRTDLYQVGVVLLECVLGHNPLRGAADADAARLMLDQLSPASLAAYGVEDGLRQTIPRLVKYYPNRRFGRPQLALDSLRRN